MNHWCEKYIGLPWTQEMDCFHHFQVIQREEFGRHLPGAYVDHSNLVLSAARIMAQPTVGGEFGYTPTTNPQEGDAVFLSQRSRPHHIGVGVALNGVIHILHALEGVGMTLSSEMDLRANGWAIRGWWTWK